MRRRRTWREMKLIAIDQAVTSNCLGGPPVDRDGCNAHPGFISPTKQQSAFDQVSEFDRGRIVAYRDCGLSFREIGSRVGRNQPTVMRICDRWMQEGTTDRRGRSQSPQCTTSHEDRKIVRLAVTDRSVTSRT
ncbi:transposable element Tcb1 transposase [Trichonephila clavipes]|nr:transposable element Tcb1 transposase [Trichonephila clavipes]